MDELQKLMGDSYKEDLTVEDITNFMKGKNFADLSKGGYVDVNKYNAEINELNGKITEKDQELKAKMTDDERAVAEKKAREQEIANLKQLLSQNTLSSNKSIANSNLSEGIGLAGVDKNDETFVAFVNNIVSEDTDKTSSITQYINTLVKTAYEKGKKDSTRDAMGNFGRQEGSSSSGQSEIGKLGKELAQARVSKSTYDYFERK